MTLLATWLRRVRLPVLSVLLTVGLGAVCQAQNYPERPIRLIAPFPAGGLADVLARAVGDEISRTLGQPVIVENRAGAGGNVGADAVAKAAPDGYTLLMTSAGILTANQFLYAKMPFDPEKDFIPVSNVADMPMMVVVNPNVQAKTLAELVALARANPGKLNFGSPGIGTTGHLGLALLMHAADIKLTHIPYKGAAPAITAYRGRPLASAGGGRQAAHGALAGSADRRRSRRVQLRGVVVVRRGRAGRHAAGHRRKIAQGDRRGLGAAGFARAFRQDRSPAARQQPG
jgi:tripartite-type tricarboxylate transporter receptor subunit TctC